MTNPLTPPLTAEQVAEWCEEGALLVPGFFSADEIAPLHDDFEKIYAMEPMAEASARAISDNSAEQGQFHVDQVEALRGLPAFGTPYVNMFRVHKRLLAAVKQLLDSEDIQIYSNYIWEKHQGKTDYSQAFHRDYATHQLLVPPDDPRFGTAGCFIYVTDVDEGSGPLHYVKASDSKDLGIHQAQPKADVQQQLMAHEKSAAGPAGSILFFNTRTYHRGTNLTAPGAVRKVIGVNYRRAGMEWIGRGGGTEFNPGLPQWAETFALADPEQLAALGIPKPGHDYWTPHTIRGTESRYPKWDSDAYRAAAGMPARADDDPAPAFEWPSALDVIDQSLITDELREMFDEPQREAG